MRSRTTIPALTLAVALVTLAAGRASASDLEVRCLNAFGEKHPPVWCAQNFTGTLFAQDLAYGHGTPGLLVVRGEATADRYIEISVTDETTSVVSTVTSHEDGTFEAELNVTMLGTHTVRSGASPDSIDPLDWGGTDLHVAARARDASSGAVSDPRTTIVTKYAATSRDHLDPRIVAVHFPPTDWCHGYAAGRCPRGSAETAKATCIPGSTYKCTVPTGQSNLSVVADDFDPNNRGNGVASEIADIHAVITQGSTVIRELHGIDARATGTGAQAHWILRIDGFASNYQGTPYLIVVTVSDAWGHTITRSSAPMTVYQW